MNRIALPVVLGLTEDIVRPLRRMELRTTVEATAAAVQASLDALALSAAPTVDTVRIVDDRATLSLTIGGRHCAAPDATLIRAFHLAAGTTPSWRTTVDDVRVWAADASPTQLATLARWWCDGAIERQPAVLLTEAQSDAYGRELAQGHGIDVPPSILRTALRTLLGLRVPLGDAALVADTLSRSASSAIATEHLVAALRPRSLDIRADPSVLRRVTIAMDHDDRELIPSLRTELFTELGVALPDLHFLADPTLPAGTICIGVNALASLPLVVPPSGTLAVNASAERLREAGISGHDAHDALLPIPHPAAVAPAVDRDRLDALGFTTFDEVGWLVLALAAVVRERAWCFVDETTVEALLDSLRAAFPMTVALVDTPLTELTTILRSLVESQVPIRNLRPILEAFALAQIDSSPRRENLMEAVRRAAAPATTESVAPGGVPLLVFLLSHELERKLSMSAASWDALLPADDLVDEFVRALHAKLGFLPVGSRPPVVLVSPSAHEAVTRITRVVFPHLRVLSFSDLLPTVSLYPVAQLGVDD